MPIIIIYHKGLFPNWVLLRWLWISVSDACRICSPIRTTRPAAPTRFHSPLPPEQWFIDWQQCGTRDYGFPHTVACAAKRLCTVPGATTPRTVFTCSYSASSPSPRSSSLSLSRSLVWPNDDSECRQQLRLIRQCPFDLCLMPAACLLPKYSLKNQTIINHKSKIEDLSSQIADRSPNEQRYRGGVGGPGSLFPPLSSHTNYLSHTQKAKRFG